MNGVGEDIFVAGLVLIIYVACVFQLMIAYKVVIVSLRCGSGMEFFMVPDRQILGMEFFLWCQIVRLNWRQTINLRF